jgi:hypothetical protein
VLDSNCFQGSPIAELEAIASQGFLLSVSIEGMRELWVRTIRKNQYDLLRARIQRLGPLLDPEHPIAFVGAALLSTIGDAPPDVAEQATAFRARIDAGWRAMQARGLTEDEWRSVGQELENEMAPEERFWTVEAPELWRYIDRKRQQLEALGYHYPESRGLAETRAAIARAQGIRTKPPIQSRGAAFLSYMTAKQRDFTRQTPASNDFYDARHLQHLVWPAFLATVDFRLIASVEEHSPQARQWVRAPVELAEDRVARCQPWGRPAARVAETFRPMPVQKLRVRQEAWRAALPRARRSD